MVAKGTASVRPIDPSVQVPLPSCTCSAFTPAAAWNRRYSAQTGHRTHYPHATGVTLRPSVCRSARDPDFLLNNTANTGQRREYIAVHIGRMRSRRRVGLDPLWNRLSLATPNY